MSDPLSEAIVAVMFELSGPAARQFQIIRDRVYAQEAEIERLTAAQADVRPCTCHPDDSPPVPCAKKYALNECRAAAQADERVPLTDEQIEAQIEARDALLDFISENGTASEGVQHYLDRYVRAALAAKDAT